MSLLFETISIRNGIAENLPWHQERLDKSYRTLFKKNSAFKLAEIIRIPLEFQTGNYRCRIEYENEITKIEFKPYKIIDINSLRLIEQNEIDYSHKFTNRSVLDKLFEMRGNCDDILIVRNGLITDTTFANIIFGDGKRWVTPDAPLLAGTCRSRLLDLGLITEKRIKINDLNLFKEARLINALRGINDTDPVPVSKIQFH